MVNLALLSALYVTIDLWCLFLVVYHYKITFHTAKGMFTDLTAGAAWIKLIGDNGVSEEIPLDE